ncbi:MAG TPA: hypothetical protein VFZ61_13750 [Polyangiales bacterium]
MNELIALVVQKTGLSEQHAKLAVETVLGFLKTKLPAPIAGQIDGLLSGGGVAGALGGLGDLGGLAGGLGDMFGGKK